MQTRLAPEILATAAGEEANEILRNCVHCGFCNATCPTFGLTGSELEGPRGRIYLVKSILEGEGESEVSLAHLDHCLGCRACETTCPSGVRFHRLADIGREVLHERSVRPRRELWWRKLLVRFFDGSALFTALVKLGRLFRPLLPRRLRRQLLPAGGPRPRGAGRGGYVLLQEGCVQPALTPDTNHAAARVLARRDIEARAADGCCGALAYHLGDVDRARRQIRRNIDAWHPALRASEGLVVTASGCAAFIGDYPSLCRGDDAYETRAAELAAATRDLADFLTPMAAGPDAAVALHLPCTLRHALKGADRLRTLLTDSGWTLAETADDGQCCGSAGAYSLLYPGTSKALGERKVRQLTDSGAAQIVTANVGCRLHLAGSTPVPVRHWIEVWDELETRGGVAASGTGTTAAGAPAQRPPGSTQART
jgi:glycolate oxidase iron-sulfur subunit